MSEKNSNEELQSRREFFKKAAKAALPVVGAVVLSSLPIVKMYGSEPCKECTNSCRGTCAECFAGCTSNCGYNCSRTCSQTCADACKRESMKW